MEKNLQVQNGFDVESIISKAIEQNISVENMERILAMRQQLKAEFAKEQFDSAMANFQAECPTIKKNKRVSFGTTNYSYAPLKDIVEQVKGLLAKNGFSYTFDTKEEDKGITVICLAKQVSGHMEKSECYIALDEANKMNVSQKSGSAMTYGKRYAFCNAFGILTGDEDNDAQSSAKSIAYGTSTSVPMTGYTPKPTNVSSLPNKAVVAPPVASQPYPNSKEIREHFEGKIHIAKTEEDLDVIAGAIAIAKDLSVSDKAMLRGKFKARKDILTPVKSEVSEEDLRDAGL